LEGGPPSFPQGSSSPTVLRALPNEAHTHAVYGTFTLSGRPSQKAFHYAAGFSTSRIPVQGPQTGPPTPTTQRCTTITCDEFGLFPVRSPLLGESRLFSSPPGTEMVQFPGSSFRHLCIQQRMSGIQPDGLPHSAIRGSRDVCSSPRLFAAYHGLLRTAAPRHPPWTLFRLTILSSRSSAGTQTLPRLHPQGLSTGLVPQTPSLPPLKLPLRAPCTPKPAPTGVSPSRASPPLGQQRRTHSSSPFPCVVKEHLTGATLSSLRPRPSPCGDVSISGPG
jgi:hypothetical protein